MLKSEISSSIHFMSLQPPYSVNIGRTSLLSLHHVSCDTTHNPCTACSRVVFGCIVNAFSGDVVPTELYKPLDYWQAWCRLLPIVRKASAFILTAAWSQIFMIALCNPMSGQTFSYGRINISMTSQFESTTWKSYFKPCYRLNFHRHVRDHAQYALYNLAYFMGIEWIGPLKNFPLYMYGYS